MWIEFVEASISSDFRSCMYNKELGAVRSCPRERGSSCFLPVKTIGILIYVYFLSFVMEKVLSVVV